MLRWVAGDEALIASRRTPSVKFAIIEPSKEAHDPIVSVFQCRRTRRPRRGEPISVPGLAGHIYPAPRGRFVAQGQASRSPTVRHPPRDDDPGFYPTSRP